MKRIMLLTLVLIGCGGGGGGDDDDDMPPGNAVERRTVFARTIDTPTSTITFDGDAAIADTDLMIAVIEAQSVDQIEMTAMAPGWSLLADDLAVMCTGMFHTWFLTAPGGTAFEFSFDVPDSFTAIVTAYAGAGEIALMDFKKMGELRNMQITYAAATLSEGSVVWMGGGGQTNWTALDAPVGMELLNATDNAAAYELAALDGNVAAIELPNDNGFCANVAQVSVEP